MTYKTHLSFGILFSSYYFLIFKQLSLSPVLAGILFFVTLLGASVPDLDTPTGGLWEKVPAGSFIGRLVHPVFIGGHRHLSHSFIGLGIFTWLFSLLLNWIGAFVPFIQITSYFILISFVLGYISHLFADSLTEEGVPLLFPIDYHFGIPPNPFEKVRIKTGQWFENLVIYPIVNIAVIVIMVNFFRK